MSNKSNGGKTTIIQNPKTGGIAHNVPDIAKNGKTSSAPPPPPTPPPPPVKTKK